VNPINLYRDYSADNRLDHYSEQDIDDADVEATTAAQRRAAEAFMRRRDAREGRREGRRAARRNRMPGMLSDDDEDLEEEDDPAGGLLAGTKPRVRRQYDERRDRDDAEGIDDVGHSEILTLDRTYGFEQEIPLEDLSDVKANSIAEWIATESVRRSIEKHFHRFLLSYADEHGNSVYGQRIKTLGESEYRPEFDNRYTNTPQTMPNPSKCPISTSPTQKRFSPTSSPIVPRQC